MSFTARVEITEPAPDPGDRKRCVGCRKEMNPKYEVVDRDTGESWRTSLHGLNPDPGNFERRWTGGYEGYGHFHSQSCATAWANRVVDVGGWSR